MAKNYSLGSERGASRKICILLMRIRWALERLADRFTRNWFALPRRSADSVRSIGQPPDSLRRAFGEPSESHRFAWQGTTTMKLPWCNRLVNTRGWKTKTNRSIAFSKGASDSAHWAGVFMIMLVAADVPYRSGAISGLYKCLVGHGELVRSVWYLPVPRFLTFLVLIYFLY